MQRPIRIGIIGAGWPGERHAEGYMAAEAQVVAISDLEEKRRKQFAATYNVSRTYADYDELLADKEIDAVSVALPNFLHHPAVLAALNAGKHVLCEKPPATTLAEAKEMADKAELKGLVLAYALQRRFNPATEKLREKLAADELGEIYHARGVWTRAWGVPRGVGNWFTDPARAGGGALIDIGVHVMDLAWFLMGCPAPLTVSGQVYNKYPNLTRTDDSAFALIRFADGRSMQLEASWVLAQEKDVMGVNLYGSKGGARLDDTSLDLFQANDEGRMMTSVSLAGGRPAFFAQANNFVRAIRGEEKPRTTAAQGVQIMALLDAIYRSSRDKREITLLEGQAPDNVPEVRVAS